MVHDALLVCCLWYDVSLVWEVRVVWLVHHLCHCPCTMCGNTFRQRTHLESHRQTVHPVHFVWKNIQTENQLGDRQTKSSQIIHFVFLFFDSSPSLVLEMTSYFSTNGMLITSYFKTISQSINYFKNFITSFHLSESSTVQRSCIIIKSTWIHWNFQFIFVSIYGAHGVTEGVFFWNSKNALLPAWPAHAQPHCAYQGKNIPNE